MAKKFLTGLNLVVLPTDPVTGSEGELYFNTSASVAKIYQAGAWSVLGAGGGSATLTQEEVQDYVAPLFTHGNHTNASVTYDDELNQLHIDVTSAPTAGFTSVLKHDVKLNGSIAKGQAVYVSSANGTNIIVSKASNASEATSSKTLGILETGGSNNAVVKVVTEGLLSGLNTSTATAGDPVWLGTDGNLIYGLANKPYGPAHLVFIGIVTRVNSNNGEIFVKVQNGFELNEIHDIGIGYSASIQNNEALVYNSSASLWYNEAIVNSLTGTNNEIEVSSSNGDITIGIPTSPVFTTPDIGAATATSINGTTIPSNETLLITDNINVSVQGYSSTLNDLAGSTLIGGGFVKSNGVGVWSIDSNEYLTTSSASTNYLTQSSASTNYLTKSSASTTYLTQSSASTNYLTQSSASSTYQPIGSYLTSESDTLETVTDRGASSTNAITITNATAASSPTTGALIVTGGVGIGEDLYVDNNVYIGGDINITGSISGSLSFINVTDLVVTDPLIYLADSNPNDMVDIGIFGAYNHSSSVQYHTGLIRDASDSGKWKLASNLLDPTSNVIDFTGATFDTLKIGALEVSNASTTRTNLGLEIGTNVQAYDADLAAIAAGTIDGGTP
jgi:hypothetical protein